MHSYVHRLRSSFAGAGERIETVGAGYRLRLEPGELDVERFEDPAATARRFADNGDTAEALDAITAAEGLWRGRPFGEFADEAWALGDVTRLVELHVGRRELRAEILLGTGQPSAIRSRLSLRAQPGRSRRTVASQGPPTGMDRRSTRTRP